MIDLHDPSTGKVRGRTTEDGVNAIATAASTPSVWPTLPRDERAAYLHALADAMHKDVPNLSVAESAGTGKPLGQARAEVAAAVECVRFYAGASLTPTAPAAGTWTGGTVSQVEHRPMGLIGSILPWNYPILMWAWQTGAILAAGCRAITKPAEQTPDTAVIIQTLIDDILPPGAHSTIYGGGRTGALLAMSSRIDGIAFTGSHDAGLSVARAAGTRPTLLELGGNAPVIIAPDAPWWTAEAIVAATVYNAGQSCAAPARILALPGTERIIADIAHRIGDTCAAAFGPVISAAAKERILTLIDRTAGQRHSGTAPDEGWYVPATIIIGADGPAVTEEVFGPVLTVEHVTASQAAKRANSTRHALSASIWTDSLTLADRLTRDLRAGEIWRNCHLTQTPGLPHTGTGGSGHGPHMSPAAIDHWTTPTTITTRTEAP